MHLSRNKKIFIYVFLFFLIGTFNNKNFENFNFIKLKQITVSGLNNSDNLKLMNSLDILKFNNIFSIDKYTLKEIINSNNLVEKYSVFKKYPSSLEIKINKTEFLAKVKKENEYFFLGSNGKRIKVFDSQKKLPYIFGNFDNKNFFELKNAIDEANFDYNEIKNLFFFKSGRWDIETYKGHLIRLPNKNIKEAIIFTKNILKKNDEKNIYKIDLRQNNQVIINGR